MRVFNLSDATPPYKPERKARTLKIKGVVIKPGESGEVPDHVHTSEFSGLIVSNMVSVDVVPDWYGLARKAQLEEAAKKEAEAEMPVLEVKTSDDPDHGAVAVEEDKPEPEELEEPKKKPKKRRKRS